MSFDTYMVAKRLRRPYRLRLAQKSQSVADRTQKQSMGEWLLLAAALFSVQIPLVLLAWIGYSEISHHLVVVGISLILGMVTFVWGYMSTRSRGALLFAVFVFVFWAGVFSANLYHYHRRQSELNSLEKLLENSPAQGSASLPVDDWLEDEI